MREINVQTAFKNYLSKRVPEPAYYKIPDAPDGGKRPFDYFIQLKGKLFVGEYKRQSRDSATNYQDYWLNLFERNGAFRIPIVGKENYREVVDWIIKIAQKRGMSSI